MKYLAILILILAPTAALAGDTPKYALLDFTATWCGPCKLQDVHFEKNADIKDRLRHITFYKIDADQNRNLCVAYKITAYPTLVLVELEDDGTGKTVGKEIARTIGAQPPAIILKLLNKATIVDANSSLSK